MKKHFATLANLLAIALTIGTSGCGKQQQQSFVKGSTSNVVGLREGVNGPVPVVNTTMTLRKDFLWGCGAKPCEFLYGADLQYSSQYDPKMDLYQQSLAIGHIPAAFRIAGDELQLISNDKRLFPSDVNHPEELLTRFKIVSQTDSEITVGGADSRVLLAELFAGTLGDTHGALTDPTGKNPRDYWIRSLDTPSNYILQQTSLVTEDGARAEFMESIFPRKLLEPGSSFKKFKMDPEDSVGWTDGLDDAVRRFRLLPGETIFQGGDPKVAYAQHFDLSAGSDGAPAMLDWYVTPNIPDEDLPAVKLAVEGWNRYFRDFKGIKRDVLRFQGRLPEGIHIGDPRYNVINWDSRLIAGAAYESQAADPETGRQSHSLIYMPAAWLKIGSDYWKNGEPSDEKPITSVSPTSLAGHGGATRSARIACLRDVREAAALLASGRLSADEIKEFSTQLLKQTLFHEVGHSLGLAHNFKGSLEFDRSEPVDKRMFSTSIMDYNDYEIERQAFDGVDSAGGPELKYDRQALSAIYDRSAEVPDSDQDSWLPACNDAEADTETDGVDPLCNRYDIEKDPTLSVSTAWNRITQAAMKDDVTLSQAVSRVPGLVLTQDTLDSVKSLEDLMELTSRSASSLVGALKFYTTGGKASLAYTLRINIKSLLKFEKDVLSEGYDEAAMRERTFSGVQKALSLTALPAPVVSALKDTKASIVEALMKTPYSRSLSADQQKATSQSLSKILDHTVDSFATDSAAGLPKLRAAVIALLARHAKVPYYLGKIGNAQVDYETAIVGILSSTVTAQSATSPERLASATALATYKGRETGDPAIQGALEKLKLERAAAADNDSRELVESIASILTGAKPGSGGG